MAYTILALETSAGPASCAVIREKEILATAGTNTRLTHSQTILPMVQDMLKNSGLSLDEVNLIAVSAGPGSFTGVRIGVAAVKGLATPRHLPCAAVSTLEAIAENAQGLPFDGVVCAVMDARCQQVYTACFDCAGGELSRRTPDEALPLDELKNRLLSYKKSVFLVGDGADLCYTVLNEQIPALRLAPPALRYQQAVGVAAVAARMADEDRLCAADELLPAYLRLPQAERELRQRLAAQGD